MLRIVRRIAVFWFESMLYFFFLPFTMAKSTVRMFLSFLFNAPTRVKEYTNNGIKIIKSVKSKVTDMKSGKVN